MLHVCWNRSGFQAKGAVKNVDPECATGQRGQGGAGGVCGYFWVFNVKRGMETLTSVMCLLWSSHGFN